MKNSLNLILVTVLLAAASCANDPVIECENGVRVRIEPVTESIVRVSATPERLFPSRSSLSVVPQKGKVKYSCRKTS